MAPLKGAAADKGVKKPHETHFHNHFHTCHNYFIGQFFITFVSIFIYLFYHSFYFTKMMFRLLFGLYSILLVYLGFRGKCLKRDFRWPTLVAPNRRLSSTRFLIDSKTLANRLFDFRKFPLASDICKTFSSDKNSGS